MSRLLSAKRCKYHGDILKGISIYQSLVYRCGFCNRCNRFAVDFLNSLLSYFSLEQHGYCFHRAAHYRFCVFIYYSFRPYLYYSFDAFVYYSFCPYLYSSFRPERIARIALYIHYQIDQWQHRQKN
ncbi:MAG: hypothetical protein V4577_23860 [Bacteroidota bacterium]